MENIRPVFKKFFVAAIVIYVVGTATLISDLCNRVGELEFKLDHITGKCAIKH